MTKTRTTKKPAAKPQRKPRKPVKLTDHITPEALGRSIAGAISDSLGRRLEDLLSPRAEPGFDAVSAWTVEKLGDGVNGYLANYATDTGPSRISPVDEALGNLRSAVTHAEVITESETERLDSVLAPSPVRPAGDDQATGGPPSLAQAIHSLAERIHADNLRRNELLDRLEL